MKSPTNARSLVEELDSDQVTASLREWVGRERKSTAAVIAHLARIDREKLFVRLGYRSIYAYASDMLEYTRGQASLRIRVARAAILHPEIIDLLADGALTLSSVRSLARYLKGGALGTELIQLCCYASVREVKAILAARFPSPQPVRRELRIENIGEGLVKLELVVSTDVADRLIRACDLDRSRGGSGEIDSILTEALDMLLLSSTPNTANAEPIWGRTLDRIKEGARRFGFVSSRNVVSDLPLRTAQRSSEPPSNGFGNGPVTR